MHSPIEQFKIKPIFELSAGGYDISFTNSSLFMLLAMVVGTVDGVPAGLAGRLLVRHSDRLRSCPVR